MKEANYIEKELYAGRFDEVVSASIDNPNYKLNSRDYPWILAALSFLGRYEELEGFYKLKAKLALDSLEDCVSQFFYALSFSRRREFKKARGLFLQNFYTHKRSSDSLVRFYLFQGLAFFRYSTGYLANARAWSQKAMSEASSSLNLFASVLAHELCGHILCNQGFLSEGFKKLEIAEKKSQSLGRGAIESAASTVKTLYRASFGLNSLAEIQSELSFALGRLKHSESYSRASILLEMGHNKILMGNLREAKRSLDEIGHLIYEVNNPYLEIKYNLYLSYLMYLEGDFSMAQVLLKSSIDKAREKFHLALLVKAQGLLYRIFKESNKLEFAEKLLVELKSNTSKNGSILSVRMLEREHKKRAEGINAGEDLLGDLLDKVKLSPITSLSQVFESGHLIFLRDIFNINSQDKIIFFDIRYRFITLFEKGSVFQSENSYTEFSRKLLSLLDSEKLVSKETLVRGIWDQEYDPLRHDGLIYSLINRTRKLLGEKSSWLENSEEGYFLGQGVKVLYYSEAATSPTEVKVVPQSLKNKGLVKSLLTSRQQEILNLFNSQAYLNTRLLVEQFQVSEATASRDLAKLYQDGYLSKQGSGRSTIYELRES